jgi:hypothetical protein
MASLNIGRNQFIGFVFTYQIDFQILTGGILAPITLNLIGYFLFKRSKTGMIKEIYFTVEGVPIQTIVNSFQF